MDSDSDLIIDDSSSSSDGDKRPTTSYLPTYSKRSAPVQTLPSTSGSICNNPTLTPTAKRTKLSVSHRKLKDTSIWDDLNSSNRQSHVSKNFAPSALSSSDDENTIIDESDGEIEKLENEVFGPASQAWSNDNSTSQISDNPTPPEEKQIYSARPAFQFYQRPPGKIKYLKGGLAANFELHLKRLKSDTIQWLHGRQNFIQEPGKLIKVKEIASDFYGRRIISYMNHNTGCDYFMLFDANERLLSDLQVGQRLEFEQKYSKHRVRLKETKKIDLDLEAAETKDSVCNVLLNVHKIKLHINV